MNRFAYANGNPVSAIDPFGTMAQDAPANGGFLSVVASNPGIMAQMALSDPGVALELNLIGGRLIGALSGAIGGLIDAAEGIEETLQEQVQQQQMMGAARTAATDVLPQARDFLAGNIPLSDVPPDIAAKAAAYFEEVAAPAAKNEADAAYQLARAQALRGNAPTPGSIINFRANFGK